MVVSSCVGPKWSRVRISLVEFYFSIERVAVVAVVLGLACKARLCRQNPLESALSLHAKLDCDPPDQGGGPKAPSPTSLLKPPRLALSRKGSEPPVGAPGVSSGKQPSPERPGGQAMHQAGPRAQKRARRALSGGESDGEFQPAEEPGSFGQSDVPGTDGFTPVVSKSEKKRALKEEAALEKLKRDLSDSKKGVFKVVLRPVVQSQGQTPPAGFPSGGLLPLFKELHQKFPSCALSGDTSGICLYAPTLELAKELMAVTSVGGSPVVAACSSLSSFKARIEQVSMAFTVEEIVAELAPLGVVSAQKFPYRRPLGKTASLGKVLLAFDRPPPPSAFLGYKSHAVIMEVAKPLLCFNCQRFGHHSSQCSLPRACKRCGAHDHLVASCSNSPRCVNCKGPHAAGANICPRGAFYAERNRLLMEARVLQQVRASAPSAVIAPELTEKPIELHGAVSTPEKTFASVVRGIAVTENGVAAPAVLLPKPRSIPRKQRAARPRRLPVRPARRPRPNQPKPRTTRGKIAVGKLGGLAVMADLLQAFSPQAAEAVRTLMTHLRPLLSLVELFQKGNVPTNTKINAAKRSK